MALQIEFNKKDGNYKAGDIVSGMIIINNNTPIEATGLKVSMNVQYKNTGTPKSKVDTTHPSMTVNLDSALFQDSKLKTKVLTIGSHRIPFIFPFLPNDFSDSFKTDSQLIRHFLEVELKTKSGANHRIIKHFTVSYLPLDDNHEAYGWQTKTVAKPQKLSLKKMSMTVIVPTALGYMEKFPIHIAIKNGSKEGMVVRSRFVCLGSVPLVAEVKDRTTVKMEYVEEMKEANGELTHYLTTGHGRTSNCVVFRSTYLVEVEVETSKGVFLKLEFPVHVGRWKKDPVREPAPFGKSDCPAKVTANATTSATTNPVFTQGAETARATPSVVRTPTPPPLPPKRTVPPKPAGQTGKMPPIPVSTTPRIPSAPPMENFGVAPPTYDEAMQDSFAYPSLYPELPRKI